jgi:hypothetical protein
MIADPRAKFRSFLVQLGLRATLGLSVAACCTLSAASVSAQSASDSATAQALFDRAKRLMRDGKFAEACSALEESQRVESRSGTALNLADCYEHAGRLASAWSTFLEAARLAKATGNAEREHGARERAAALAPRLSNLVISTPSAASTPGLEIRRDGELVGSAQLGLPLPADSGKHTVAAKAPGRKPWQTEVTVQGSASTANVAVPDLERDSVAAPVGAEASVPGAATAQRPRQSVAFAAPEPTADGGVPSRGNGGVIAGGVVTGVFLVGTVVTSVLYSSKLHAYNTANDQYDSNAADLRAQAKTLGAVNLALLGGAVVAAGVTVYLWTRPQQGQGPTSARLQLRGVVSPELAGVSLGGSL